METLNNMTTKTILITGCSSGIGRLTALHFQKQGWNVVATVRKPNEENRLTRLKNVLVNRIDVTDHISISIAIAEAISRFKKIDVVVNSAGYGSYGLLEATDFDSVRRQFEVNVIGPMAVTKGVLPYFRKEKKGMIINVSSMGAKVPFPLGALYHGSKSALEGMSEALSFELESIGVQIKLIEPGAMATNFAGPSLELNLDSSISEYRSFADKVMAKMGKMDRAASNPQIVAHTIYQAVTDNSKKFRYVVGDDAEQLIAARKRMGDLEYFDMIRGLFEISGIRTVKNPDMISPGNDDVAGLCGT